MNFKKYITLLLAVLMLAGVIPAAAIAADPSVAPETGNLVIHRYLLVDPDQAENPNDGTVVTPPAAATPLDGITYNLYKITIGDDGIYPSSGPVSLNNYTNPTTMTDINAQSFAVAEAFVPSVVTGSDGAGTGQATASNLPQGIYLVVEQPLESVSSPAAPFIVAVPMTNPTGDGWLSTVHVYPKNESMSIEKTVNSGSVNIGDEVNYSIVPSVPLDIKEANKYNITDQLDLALTYKADSVTVKAATTKAGLSAGTPLTENTHYTVSHADNKLTVSFTAAGRAELFNQGYTFLQIDFTANVNKNILNNPNYTVSNSADIEFENQEGVEKEISTVTPADLNTGALKLLKKDALTDAVLSGAKFKIADSEQNGKDAFYLRLDGEGNVLYPDDIGYDTATDWEITTDASGLATLAGIKYYTIASGNTVYQDYWLVETQAPTGYNMLSGPVKISFDNTATAANSYTLSVTVTNNKGFMLPKTGGTGTLLFTVSGIALVGISILLIIATKKKKEPSGK